MVRMSLVIPCYNEARSLPQLVARCGDVVCAELGCEIVLVDNGSTDDTPDVLARELAGKAGIRSVRVPVNRGYGHGILEGLRACESEILGWTHADLQTDPMDAVRGFAMFRSERDPARLFVKGSRRGRPIADTAFTFAMSLFETLWIGHPMRDINAQPTLFPRTFLESWRDPPEDFALDLFAYAAAKSSRMRVRRFPVLFAPRQHGESHWNVDWKAKARFIRRTLDFSVRLRRDLAARNRASA
ncbi:MAG: glycosyltransferase family 2 protein [Sphingomicrobium sp.]